MAYNNKDNTSHNIVEEAMVAYNTIDDLNTLQLINALKKGIRYSLFKSLLEKIPFSLSEWSAFLHLSERTMQRYKKEKKSFDPISSERIVAISMLYNYGKEVFGSSNDFNTWLQTKNIAMGGIIPKDLLDSSFGISLIKDELTRIEHGVLA